MLDIPQIRSRFPALNRVYAGQPACYFDGPAGSQVPVSVAEAVAWYLLNSNANCAGDFATSRETDTTLSSARGALADFLQVNNSDEIVFGPNMTTLTLSLSRALAKTWNRGDEIIVSRLDHDANFTPWHLAAERVGAVVKYIEVNPDGCTLNLDSFRDALSERTKLVAVGLASNATGTLNPVAKIAEAARSVGALMFVDAVHSAPHRRTQVGELGCDFLVCSAYKFFGPHVGVLWGRRALLEELKPDKLRPAPFTLPGKWMTGTQNHEGIAGAEAAIDYLADLSSQPVDVPRRERLDDAFTRITNYERSLSEHFLDGLRSFSNFKVWGITDRDHLVDRVPTFSLTHQRFSARELSARLAEKGIFTWSGHHYALPFTEAVGLEPNGTLRIGLLHYNTSEEIDRLFEAFSEIERS